MTDLNKADGDCSDFTISPEFTESLPGYKWTIVSKLPMIKHSRWQRLRAWVVKAIAAAKGE